jgi:hypothetical protein
MKMLIAVAVALVLAGCVEGPPASTPPDMTFANLQPLRINAARIDIVDSYKPPMGDPNVEHTFRTPPYIAAGNLLRKQLVAVGGENALRAIIQDASVVREEIPHDSGLFTSLVPQPAWRLKAKVLLRFELYNPAAPDIVIGHADVIARREKTLMEGISPSVRDRAYFSLTQDLMNDLNDGMRTIVQNTFGIKDE